MIGILESSIKGVSLPTWNNNPGKVKNLLIELEQATVEHFITKSYITADFEEEEYRVEYHIYHKFHPTVGKWSDKCTEYPFLKCKPLSRKEVQWFRNNIEKYKIDQDNPDGTIWIHKKVGFSAKQQPVKKLSGQLSIFDFCE